MIYKYPSEEKKQAKEVSRCPPVSDFLSLALKLSSAILQNVKKKYYSKEIAINQNDALRSLSGCMHHSVSPSAAVL